jgi:alpha,alpha-trehalase
VAGVRDTYWIIKGLLVSGMRQTATGMVRNLVTLAAAHGHVPNGARTYYLNRSQPPLLSAMIKLLLNANCDGSLLEEAFPVRSGLN